MALHQEPSIIYKQYNHMGSGLLWQTFVKHYNSYIHKCQLKLYCAKRKSYVNCVQKHCRLLWPRRHLGWTITQWKRVLWSDKSVFQVFCGRNGRRVLGTKEEKDHSDCC